MNILECNQSKTVQSYLNEAWSVDQDKTNEFPNGISMESIMNGIILSNYILIVIVQ